MKLFSEDLSAVHTSNITNISRPTINKIYSYIRKVIADDCEKNAILEVGEIELDESYFGARRVKGIRGRGAKGKIPVFRNVKTW